MLSFLVTHKSHFLLSCRPLFSLNHCLLLSGALRFPLYVTISSPSHHRLCFALVKLLFSSLTSQLHCCSIFLSQFFLLFSS
ncbi:hypothetical protein DsansV1_C10g0099031 [Dioscorea sansibarensis]